MKANDVRDVLTRLFEEEALLIGGLVAEHAVEDDFVWRLMRSMDLLRRRLMADVAAIGRRSPGTGGAAPHPAIQQFLSQLRRPARAAAASGSPSSSERGDRR